MLWSYSLGVAHHLHQNYDHRRIKVFVSSAGSFGGVPLVLGLDPYVAHSLHFFSGFCKSNRMHARITF
jgi:hypothetical protein